MEKQEATLEKRGKRCKYGVNKRTGACLKRPRRK
jgi:hypothetical protein